MMGLPITLTITSAGLDALVDAGAGATDPIVIAEIGLSEAPVTPAPTIDALAGEFKRLSGISGQSVAENVIHLTAQDTSADIYSLRSFALYLDDGTLFAIYGQGDPIFTKVSIASFLIALDVAFSSAIADDIVFGDALFLYPPATETVEGVAKIATQARVDAEADAAGDENAIVTPKTLRARLTDVMASVAGLFAARSITGDGLVTGGGTLAANRTLNVSAASAVEAIARFLSAKAVTPLSLFDFADFTEVSDSATATCWQLRTGARTWSLQMGKGTALAANSTVTVDFPTPFTTKNYAMASGVSNDTGTEGGCAQSGFTLTGITVVNNGAQPSNYTWVAFGW